jgi:MFS family permease
MFQWMRDLTQGEKRTMAGCFGGWSLDALDVQIYSFVIPTLLATWHISKGEAGLLGTVTLVVSAFGGWFAGALSDRYGRVRVLQITVLWYAVFTFLCGFAQNFEQLFVLRALQGLGFGAEWSAGAVLMGEMIRDKYRGRAVGFVQSGWAVGWGAAALLYTLLFAILPDVTAWRVMFWIGLTPALLVFWIRRTISEPEVFNARKNLDTNSLTQAFSVLKPPYLPTTIKVAMMVTGAQGGSYALSVWLPTFLKTERHLSSLNTGSYLLIHIFGAFIGFLVGAYLSDLIGRKRTFIVSALGSVLSGDLSRRADQRRHDAGVGCTARFHSLHDVLGDGAIHDRAVSDRGARRRPGLLLQFGPCDRRAVSHAGRLPQRQTRTWQRHPVVCAAGLWRHAAGTIDAAGDEGTFRERDQAQ